MRMKSIKQMIIRLLVAIFVINVFISCELEKTML